MDLKHKEFINKALQELKGIFGIEGTASQNNRELIMTTFMHIVSYQYDDREPINKTDEEILEIARRTTKRDTPDSNVGKILRCRPEDAQRLNILHEDTSEEGRKKWSIEFSKFILEKTRNAICHGCFIINDDDTITIDNTNPNNPFKITYQFDCLCDVCKELANKEQLKYYEELLGSLKEGKPISFEDSKNKLIYFDLLVNLLVSYNEQEVYSEEFVNKFNELTGSHFNLQQIKHIRNSVTHHYRCFMEDNEDEICILDYRDKNRDRISSNFNLNFDKIIDFSRFFSIERVYEILQNGDTVRE